MQVDPNTVNKPLPGYGVLKELKSQHNFQKLEVELEADSTPSLGANEVRKIRTKRGKRTKFQNFFFFRFHKSFSLPWPRLSLPVRRLRHLQFLHE
jgi:hypothetical protein